MKRTTLRRRVLLLLVQWFVLVLVALAVASLQVTPREVHAANRFEFGPIIEVGVLFAGIFVTMVAPLQVLNAHGASLGLSAPWTYFWASGLLSSVLDNAPTYLVFFNIAGGDAQQLMSQMAGTLMAISAGAVFMGANTYIGNAPNFMVKAIAEERGIKMPSFFGYMLWSGAILIPCFVLVTFVFFR